MAKVLHIWFVTSIACLWLPLSRVSALYCYHKNMVLRFVRYGLVFDHLVWKFVSIYTVLQHNNKQQHNFFVMAIVTCEFTMLILQKFGFKIGVISFNVIQLILKFTSIYPASTHIHEQKHNFISLTSYHIATTEHRYCIRGQPIVVREIITPI